MFQFVQIVIHGCEMLHIMFPSVQIIIPECVGEKQCF